MGRENEIVVVSAVRTPFGKFGGALRNFRNDDLGAMVMKEAVKRVNLDPAEIGELYYGITVLLEPGTNLDIPARMATLKAGFPASTLSLTIDRACCSSINAVKLACRAIECGATEISMAVGVECMSNTPLFVKSDVRWGSRLGDIAMEDILYEFGYGDAGFNPVSVDAGEVALEHGVTREDQDRWAYTTQMRYKKAFEEGKYKIGEELMSVTIPQRKGPQVIMEKDEFPRPSTTMEGLAKLKTIYGSPTVTAGNAPGLNDGAVASLLMTRKKAEEKGLEPLGTIVAYSDVAVEPRYIATAPVPTIESLLDQANVTLDDIKLIEINEAFAAMPVTSCKILAKDDPAKLEELLEKTNVNGGCIAVGHPVGSSGLRIMNTLFYELKRRNGGYGIAAICGGLAQGAGVLVRVD